jgi:hypothetical protein
MAMILRFRFTAVEAFTSRILFTPADANDAQLRIYSATTTGALHLVSPPSVFNLLELVLLPALASANDAL